MAHAPDVTRDAEDGTAAVDPRILRHVFGHFLTGVTVVSALHGGAPVGLTVGSFFSVSLDPPLVGFCAGKNSTTWPAIRAAGRFCVNVLSADQEELCRRFAVSSGDKFRGVNWTTTGGGSPRLERTLAWIDCEVDAVHEAGDHEICIGRVRMLAARRDLEPLLFFRGQYLVR
jgi:3-hydroxy-9,10-secoandrosta-1,3,5(10)-triene-9,17-dione monooxygenase reductase component